MNSTTFQQPFKRVTTKESGRVVHTAGVLDNRRGESANGLHDYGITYGYQKVSLIQYRQIENKKNPIEAKIAQSGERMTEDHKVRCSIHLLGAFL